MAENAENPDAAAEEMPVRKSPTTTIRDLRRCPFVGARCHALHHVTPACIVKSMSEHKHPLECGACKGTGIRPLPHDIAALLVRLNARHSKGQTSTVKQLYSAMHHSWRRGHSITNIHRYLDILAALGHAKKASKVGRTVIWAPVDATSPPVIGSADASTE